jgi:hypothetical protein
MRVFKILETVAMLMIISGVVGTMAAVAVNQVIYLTASDKPQRVYVTELEKRIYRDSIHRGVDNMAEIEMAVEEARMRGEQW